MEHEEIRIPPFSRLNISGIGSVGYVAGNLPYIAFSEGPDTMRLPMGNVLPLKTVKAELFNPFSVWFRGQIIRGAPVSIGPAWENNLTFDNTYSMAGTMLKSSTAGGDPNTRRRGMGIISKRGVYRVRFAGSAGTGDGAEIMVIRKAHWGFAAARPAGVFVNVHQMLRRDGTENSELVCLSGTYTRDEIDTWKASVGHTPALISYWVPYTGLEVQVDAETAVFVTSSDSASFRMNVEAKELGDMISGKREF